MNSSEVMATAREAIEYYISSLVSHKAGHMRTTDGHALVPDRIRWRTGSRVATTDVWITVHGVPVRRTYTLVEIGDQVTAVSTDQAGAPHLVVTHGLASWSALADHCKVFLQKETLGEHQMSSAQLAELEGGSPSPATLVAVAGLSPQAANAVLEDLARSPLVRRMKAITAIEAAVTVDEVLTACDEHDVTTSHKSRDAFAAAFGRLARLDGREGTDHEIAAWVHAAVSGWCYETRPEVNATVREVYEWTKSRAD